jgi:putative PIN family toxin of toxin-antitoxin system
VRIVLDTNVFISGVFFSGPPYKILEAWRDGRIVLVVSPEILEEYYRVGENLSSRYAEVDITPVLEFVTINAEIVSPPDFALPICTDPDDDKFFTCAIAGHCPVIISGDRHLLDKSGFYGIQLRKPRDFVDNLLPRI